MKNRFILAMMFVASVLSLTSCDKDTEGVTGITYYPVLELEGATTLYVDKGTAFTDPGYTATLNGKDITSQVAVASNVNSSVSGVYSVKYSVFNEDGFSANASRKVVVLDANDAIEGIYTTKTDSYRDYNGTVAAFGKPFETLIIGNGDGTYSMSDILGGWYAQRAGYGDKYAMTATVSFGADGTASLKDSYIAGWGDGLEGFEGTYDAASKTFTYVATYVNGMQFYVTMSKN